MCYLRTPQIIGIAYAKFNSCPEKEVVKNRN